MGAVKWQNQLKTKSDNVPTNFGSKLENPKEAKTNFGILQSETCRRRPTAAEQLLCPDRNKSCPICFGIGWVCENHPDRAWHEALGCQCGAGMPCQCNVVDAPDTSQIIEEQPVTGH
jgi:hypothetical protein